MFSLVFFTIGTITDSVSPIGRNPWIIQALSRRDNIITLPPAYLTCSAVSWSEPGDLPFFNVDTTSAISENSGLVYVLCVVAQSSKPADLDTMLWRVYLLCCITDLLISALYAPRIVTQSGKPGGLEVFPNYGTCLSLECQAVGEPSPDFVWLKDDQVLKEHTAPVLYVSTSVAYWIGQWTCEQKL